MQHLASPQLLWVLDLVVVKVLVKVLQLLLPEQETSCWLPCVDVLLHHVGFDLLDECVGGTLALHSWLSEHLHMLGPLLLLLLLLLLVLVLNGRSR